MGLLASIQKGKRKAPRRIMVYGPHGVGKSTFASEAPAPIFIPTEDGIAGIDCHSFPLAKTSKDVLTSLAELRAEEHKYRTVVIDSLDWLERLIWDAVCKDKGVDNIEDIGYAKGYTFALNYWRDILRELTLLRDTKKMSCILLAHCQIEKFENPETDTYDRYSPKLHKKSSALMQEWCDEVLFASYQIFTKNTDEGFGKKRTQGVGQGDRILRTCDRPAHVAKNRLNLEPELPFEWAAFVEAAKNGGK